MLLSKCNENRDAVCEMVCSTLDAEHTLPATGTSGEAQRLKQCRLTEPYILIILYLVNIEEFFTLVASLFCFVVPHEMSYADIAHYIDHTGLALERRNSLEPWMRRSAVFKRE